MGTRIDALRDAWRRGGRERGSATNIQAAVLYPLLLITFLTILQSGLYLYGRDLARSAARTGVDQGRAFGTLDAGAARIRTEDVLVSRAGGILDSPAVTADRTATTMTVTVDARVVSLVPGLDLRVTQSSTAALEQVTE